MEQFMKINTAVNGFVWGPVMLVLLVGTGIYLSIAVGFIQFTKIGYWWKNTIGKIFKKGEAGDGEITPLQAVSTALASTVGTGNIAGVTGAIILGGPGAVFWIWVLAILGMCTKYCEVALGIKYRRKNDVGEWVGGPMYYIKNGLGRHWQFLAVLYSLFGVLTVFGTGNATQVNTIVAAIDTALTEFNVVGQNALSTLNLVVGIVVAMLVAMVLLGGIKRIGSVSERLVPFMALFYIVLAVGVVILNIQRFPAVIEAIFAGAFNPAAFTGGTIGSLFISMQKGVSRGIFSNEAGLGTGSIAHACADTDRHDQHLQRIYERNRRQRILRILGHEDAVYDVVQRVDDHGDHRRQCHRKDQRAHFCGSHFILLFQKLQPPNVKGSRVRISNAAPYSLSYI